jgi:hypothetical protein
MSGNYSKFGMWWLKMSDFVFMITVVVNGVGLMDYLKKRVPDFFNFFYGNLLL